MSEIIYTVPILGLIGLLYTLWKSAWVQKQDPGTEKMQKIASHIYDGAMAFLRSEYKILSIFVVVIAILLAVSANDKDSSPIIAVSFLVGALC